MDYIKRFTTREGVRMSLAVTTDTVETARVRHDLWPVATAALGRAMTGAILLAGDFKNHENVSLRIKGDGDVYKRQSIYSRIIFLIVVNIVVNWFLFK